MGVKCRPYTSFSWARPGDQLNAWDQLIVWRPQRLGSSMFHFWISLCVGAIRSHSNGYSWTWLKRNWYGNLRIRDHKWTIITIWIQKYWDTEKRHWYSALFFLYNVRRVSLSGDPMSWIFNVLFLNKFVCVCANRLYPNWYLCTRLIRSCNLEVPWQNQYHGSWMRAAF